MLLKKIYGALPGWSFPDLQENSITKWNIGPIQHWRKADMPNFNFTISRSSVTIPMNIPGGFGSASGTSDKCDLSGSRVGIVQEVFTTSENTKCMTEKNAKYLVRTIGSKISQELNNNDITYSVSSKEYLEKRKKNYSYNTTQHVCSENNQLINIVKHSNEKFATQGAVSNGARLERLKRDTMSENCGSRGRSCMNHYHTESSLPPQRNVKCEKLQCNYTRFRR